MRLIRSIPGYRLLLTVILTSLALQAGGAPNPSMEVDARSAAGTFSNANGVLEPGEVVLVAPFWKNTAAAAQTFTGLASNLTGPAGPTYLINDAAADYGTINAGATGDCDDSTRDCYRMTVFGARPSSHWDATFTETLSPGSVSKSWTLHVGDSFPDVPDSDVFYNFIENLFHNGVTAGKGDGTYGAADPVTRAQMAVFLLKGKFGAAHVPPPATGTVFDDVHTGDFAGDWIEELASLQITAGCDANSYCPNDPVTRAQMAVFLLKSEHGSMYSPPTCTGIFADVACSPTPAFAVDWIERLSAEGITGGCAAAPPGGLPRYCPDAPNTRGEMAVFLVKTFALQLYGGVFTPVQPFTVAPSTTDPAIDDNGQEHYVYLDPTVFPAGKLFVFFAGTDGAPQFYQRVCQVAAAGGYHAIGLSYPNSESINDEICVDSPDPDCQESVRLETLDGIDRTPLVDVDADNCIENRLIRLLEYLAATRPGDGWDSFLTSGQLRWDLMALGGHSQGGGFAAIIGEIHVVHRVAMFSSTEPSPWTTKPLATPPDRYYGFAHEQEEKYIGITASWENLQIPGALTRVDGVAVPFGGSHRLTTLAMPAGPLVDGEPNWHGCVVLDFYTPATGGGPLFRDVWGEMIGP